MFDKLWTTVSDVLVEYFLVHLSILLVVCA